MKPVEVPITNDEIIGWMVMISGFICLAVAAYCWITRERDEEEEDNASLR